jgi:hypothetical protein
MELTKEYFDQVVGTLATKEAINGLVTKEDLTATKQGLRGEIKASEQRVIKRIGEAQEELARIVAETIAIPFTQRFDELEAKLDYSERIRLIEQRLAKLEDERTGSKFSLRRTAA